MKKLKLTKENISISLILILSSVLNFANIGIEGYGNSYYAAGVKSMTLNLKNFFFVSFDPGSFVTIDKPPMGFWIQALFAKILGFNGWSILLPQALAGVISVYLIYFIVKRSFGSAAGLISGLCLSVTPVFVAASRNNTIDNLLVLTLLFACLALTLAAEKGKAKYLYLSLILVGIGFNIKMLEAYMIGPAIYITYLLSSSIALKKRIVHIVIGTFILLSVSLSWALIVDLVPAQNRPYIGSSTDNSVMELIVGHNGLERLGISSKSNKGFNDSNNKKDDRQIQNNTEVSNDQNQQMNKENYNGSTNRMISGAENRDGQGDGSLQKAPNEGMPGGGPGGQGGLQGTFGGQTKAGIARLFSKNSLSDQIIWFLPLALLGFVAGAIKEKLRLKLDNKRKISLALWILWLVPEFIYFSYTTGLFHPYYLTMMAPPAAALAGIGIVIMWKLYNEKKWASWLLPISLIIEGLVNMMMLSYFSNNISYSIRKIILIALLLCFLTSSILAILNLLSFIRRKNNTNLSDNKDIHLKKILLGISIVSILTVPFIGSSAAITHSVNSTIPTAGLELLSNSERGGASFGKERSDNGKNSKLLDFLKSNITTEKYLLVVPSSQSADSIIIQTGEPVMALGGFSGSDKILSLDEFKEMVKNGEVRYVLTGGMGRGESSEILKWVAENGTLVPESQYKDVVSGNEPNIKDSNDIKNKSKDDNQNVNSISQNMGGPGGNNSEQLYDLKEEANILK
ncbi:glycosyltransferase family 39 protein [Clostridium beijerinckii]|uniref:glycosyltransferase family 39 protein n=1 Tax=Clostridium beijerinckii TaxID=1520 RepID=UPI00030806BA|nr:glycosyltransferase family 39 protein [Clostridium beijerinckii]